MENTERRRPGAGRAKGNSSGDIVSSYGFDLNNNNYVRSIGKNL
jgi:hypothetical protein